MASLLTRMRRNPRHFFLLVLTSPVIYGLLIPFAIADLSGTIYQHICFRVYGIPRVKRREHVVLDRVKLTQLGFFDKLNCLYCEYGNGVISYVREITARTEWYWCPIKHAREMPDPHAHYDRFMGYDEADQFTPRRREERQHCRACEKGCV